eukprot:364101-Chlamydomonas_euryale.AAC.5
MLATSAVGGCCGGPVAVWRGRCGAVAAVWYPSRGVCDPAAEQAPVPRELGRVSTAASCAGGDYAHVRAPHHVCGLQTLSQ